MVAWRPWRRRSLSPAAEPKPEAARRSRAAGEAGALGRAVAWLLVATSLGVLGVVAWSAWMLRGLPVVPEPFDLDALRAVQVPDDRNAAVVYREAAAAFPALDMPPYKVSGALAWQVSDWARAEPGLQRYVLDHRDGLDAWLAGADRPESLAVSLATATLIGRQEHLEWVERPARVALLEASRIQAEGPADPAAVWRLERGALRASRHVGQHGGAYERMTGYGLLRQALPTIKLWAADPAVDATLLRQALADALSLEALTPPDSEALRVDYVRIANELDAPGYRARLIARMNASAAWASRLPLGPELMMVGAVEPERSRRLLRLLYGHWIPGIDQPALRGTLTAHMPGGVYLFDPKAGRPGPARPLARSRDQIDAHARSTLLAPRFLALVADLLPLLEADRRLRAELIVTLAGALWTRERGGPPPAPEALVGPYLDRLPEGFAPPPAATGPVASPPSATYPLPARPDPEF